MTRLLAQLSALVGFVWLAAQLGRDAAIERAALTAAVVALTAYVAGLAVLAAVRIAHKNASASSAPLAHAPTGAHPAGLAAAPDA